MSGRQPEGWTIPSIRTTKAAILAALLCAGPVAAHDGAMGTVKERMDGMLAIGKAMKALAAFSKETELDLEAIAAQSEIILEHSGQSLLDRFPAGDIGAHSEASPAIWSNWEKFEALAFEMEAFGTNLTTITSPLLLQNALVLGGQTCANCHKSFRIKKD